MDAQIVEAAKIQADLCKLFSSASRVLIVWSLVEKELSVSEIASAIGASLQNTSQHLQLLKTKDIVVARREGNTIYYSLHPHQLQNNCLVISRMPPCMHQTDVKISTE